MKVENLMEAHSSFLTEGLSLHQMRMPTKRYNYPVVALLSSVLIHITGGWLFLYLTSAPIQRRTLPIDVTIITSAPEKEHIPLPAPVVPKIDKPIRSVARSLPAPALAPSSAPRPVPVVERSTPTPAPAKTTEQTVAPVPVVPAASPREAVQPLNVPAVQRALKHAPAASAVSETSGSKAAGEAQPVIGPSFDAAYLSNPVPKYPAAARRLKLQGTATVRVLVSPEGRPRSVALSKTSGTRILDEAALEAVQQWSFVPARRGSRPVAAEVDVPVRFRLNQ